MLSEIIKKEGKVQKVTAKKKRFRHRASFALVVSHLWYQRATVMATNGRRKSSQTFQFVNWHDNICASYILTNHHRLSSFHLVFLLLHRVRVRMIKTRNHTVVH